MTEWGRSLWLDQLETTGSSRPALQGDVQVDVAIVGAGFTGLWTAHELRRVAPELTVMIIEKHHVGFGASGRNGGWVVGDLAAPLSKYVARAGRDEALRLTRAIYASVDEIGRVAAEENIDCGFAKAGAVRMARNEPQRQRQLEDIAWLGELGLDDQFRLLDQAETEAMVGASQILGGIHFAPCASVDPARLVAGLAASVESAGAVIVERTAASVVEPGRVVTEHGTVTARHVIRATEGYTRDLKGERRTLLPLYTRMVATAPLDEAAWRLIHLTERPTFADDRHMVIYGQRTEDDRIAFGGRGVPYRFGSRIDPAMEVAGHELIREALVDLFPILADVEITHRWGGVMGVPRNWTPFVDFDSTTCFGTAGGYIGEGVVPANLAGRTLAHAIAGLDSDLLSLPWVGYRSRRWEFEPLRWIGVRGSRFIMGRADGIENRRGTEAKAAVRLSRWLRGG